MKKIEGTVRGKTNRALFDCMFCAWSKTSLEEDGSTSFGCDLQKDVGFGNPMGLVVRKGAEEPSDNQAVPTHMNSLMHRFFEASATGVNSRLSKEDVVVLCLPNTEYKFRQLEEAYKQVL